MTNGPPPAAFRCATASRQGEEAIAGSAPGDVAWLFVEHAGPWGRQAVAESRLDEEVRAFLADVPGVRVQLVRRHGGVEGPGVRVFLAHLGDRPRVWTGVLGDVREVLDLDLAGLAAGRDPGLAPYDEPLWLVCTNGRRDLCCAEIGRPIAAALAARWPEATWETTHLGGHRFSGTLLALPAGIVLGRLDAESAVPACAELESGIVPVTHARGRAGLAGSAQVAELHVRRELGLAGVADVMVEGVDGGEVLLRVPGGRARVVVEESLGAPARQSCADLKTKPAAVYDVRTWTLLAPSGG